VLPPALPLKAAAGALVKLRIFTNGPSIADIRTVSRTDEIVEESSADKLEMRDYILVSRKVIETFLANERLNFTISRCYVKMPEENVMRKLRRKFTKILCSLNV